MNRHLRVMVLVHEDLLPPEDLTSLPPAEAGRVKTEFDVVTTLRAMGHDVSVLGVSHELGPIRHAVHESRPHVVFNLLEEFKDMARYDAYVVSYLELLGVPYTGSNPRGLMLSRDKALSKKLFVYHRIATPRFFVARIGRKVRRPGTLDYPLIVKSQVEEASFGIAKASVVRDDEQLAERVRMIHERIQTDALIERFVEGREVYVAILGNERLTVLPPQELEIEALEPGEPLVATAKVKHDEAYQERHGVKLTTLTGPEELVRRLARTAKRVYRTLGLDGYARIDFRLDGEGRVFVLEANPNPEIAKFEELAMAAEVAGLDYEHLLQRVLSLALRRRPSG